MQTPQAQPDNSQIDPNNVGVALGFSTNALTQHLQAQAPQQPQEQPQTPENTPESAPEQEKPEAPKEEKDPMKEMKLMFTQKLDEIRQELKTDNQREIDTLKETITSALAEEDTNEPDKTA